MSINEFFTEFIDEAKASLERTPDVLPVLKEAGVVDSGGAGLIVIIEGMAKAVEGEFVSEKPVEGAMHTVGTKFISKVDEVNFGYCTEFILQIDKDKSDDIKEAEIYAILEPLGDSMVIVKDEDILKVHIHTLK